MKNIFITIAVVLTALYFAPTFSLAADKDISIVVAGQKLELEEQPIMFNDRVMVPIRDVLENIGFAVFYEEIRQRIEINCITKYTTITFTKFGSPVDASHNNWSETDSDYYCIGRNIFVNGEIAKVDELLIILNNKIMVSARSLSEVLGAQITWNAKSATVTINAKIPKTDRLSAKDIADCNAFTPDAALKIAENNLIYRYFERGYTNTGSTFFSYEKGNKVQNIWYYNRNYPFDRGRILHITQTGGVTFSIENYDYSEYPQYPIASHAKYLPFQEKYDGSLGGIAYVKDLEDGLTPFNEEYSLKAPDGLFDVRAFDIVNTEGGTEYFLLFPKYDGTTIDISLIEMVEEDGSSSLSEKSIYSGKGPVLLCANSYSHWRSLPNTVVKFTLGENSANFCPQFGYYTDRPTFRSNYSDVMLLHNGIDLSRLALLPEPEPRHNIINLLIYKEE